MVRHFGFVLLMLLVPLLTSCEPTGILGVSHQISKSAFAITQSGIADTVFVNGAIYTVDQSNPWAEAVAIQDGWIVYIGDKPGAEAWIGNQTEVIDIQGLMLVPGFHDVHAHPLEAGSEVAGTCLLPSDTDPEKMIDLIRRCASNQVGTDWVLGFGHSILNLLDSKRAPVDILDEAIPDQPAIMLEQTSHSAWVNSLALEIAGITKDTPNPPGGIIVKDPISGEPNGILFDNAGNMVMDLALAPTPELEQFNYDGLLYSLERLAENGITSVSDARTYWRRNYHEAWLRAERENTLSVRAVLGLWGYPHLDDAEQIRTLKSLYSNDPNRLLRMSQVKVYSDGLIENTTAALLQPYLEDLGILPGNTGLNYYNENRLANFIAELETVGFDFHIHTIGDRGVREALNAIEQAMRRNGSSADRRHRLTHLELIDPADRTRFAELNVIADFQLAGDFTERSQDRFSAPLIGTRAFDRLPVRDVYNTGAMITLSSDWDVSDLTPFNSLQRALQRGDQSLPNLDAAIRAYTINGAYLMRQEDLVGSIEVGKFADLIVVDRNLFEIPVSQINRAQVLLTMLEGNVVFKDLSF